MKLQNCKWVFALFLAALVISPSAGFCLDAPATLATETPALKAIHAAHFAEPIVASAPTSNDEDQTLSAALQAYAKRSRPDDVSSLAKFVSAYPRSGWTPALQSNLGSIYLHDGYFSKAIDAWKQAWAAGKGASEPHARALADGAVGNLASLYGSLGKMDELSALFLEIGDRPVTGSATESVQTAREQLVLSKKNPRHLFICGPVALKSLLLSQGAKFENVGFLQWYLAGPKGTNLAEVGDLADKAGFSHRLIFRKPGQTVPIPSVVHWKVGHFAAIIGKVNGRYRVADPVFPGREIWVTPSALDQEASGYYLVSAKDTADAAWRTVEKTEAGRIWGKGPTDGTAPGDAGDSPADDGPDGSNSGGASGPDDSGAGAGGDGPGPVAAGAGDGPTDSDPADQVQDDDQDQDDEQDANDDDSNEDTNYCPLCIYNIAESSVAVTLADTPVGYTPPIGPSARVRISYNQREASQPQVFSFFNVSPKWTLNWLTYVTDDPTNPGGNVSRYMAGGGAFYYLGFNSSNGQFTAQDTDGSLLVITSQNPITYQRRLKNGAVEVYSQSDGSTSYPRNVFLTKKIDPQGNAVTLNYDGQQRLASLTDAVGRLTTFTYGLASQPLLLTQVTDPFGRSAKLTYDSVGRLSSITDIIGLKSSFTYDANSLVNTLSTPYGVTRFSYTAPGADGPPRFVQVTDPLGLNERVEWVEPAPIPDSDPAATIPQGMPVPLTNRYLSYRSSFYWDKNAYIAAGCTPTGGCDYSKARDTHYNHVPPNTNLKSTSVESVKYALENRIWNIYPGQSSGSGSIYGGTFNRPIATARVLDDGTTQLSQATYDPVNFHLLQRIDPLGRITNYSRPNHIDVAAVSQTSADGTETFLAQYTYNGQHRPLVHTDAAGQTTFYSYNGAGQLTSVTNPLGQKTTYQYDASHNLSTIINANAATTATYTYDAYNRVATSTDSEGWTVSFEYDNANRVTKKTYPDGSADTYTYDKLDLAVHQDRQGRIWRYTRDADRRLTMITDPQGQQTLMDYNGIGKLTKLTDPNSNVTQWTYDVEGRLTSKQYADASTVTYTYESTTSRLKSVTDALGQVKQFAYAQDNRVLSRNYSNAVNPTPNISFTYDPYFSRRTSMTDGNGTTQYSYVPAFSLGALKRLQECFTPAGATSCSFNINYDYDELGRLASHNISGAETETFAYDAIGRTTNHASDLGAFTLSYLGQTSQITQRQLASSTLATNWSYLPNSGDRRLSGISNTGLATGQFSNYQYTTTAEKLITSIAETSDATALYPSPPTQTASYNNLNQLTNLSGQALSFDANGNLLSDGARNYSWDAENRLIGITYPPQPGKATTFAYDGLSRRVAITSTPAGGIPSTTSYIWCGSKICQARDASGNVQREYFKEGEFTPGSPGQSNYYGVDQIGSVRRVFASTSNAPAFSFDPWGNALQSTTPLTDFTYAGMLFNADSGLYLTQYRGYDPVTGRWLSRDPSKASGDAANLYLYASNNPLSFIDLLGLCITMEPGLGNGGEDAMAEAIAAAATGGASAAEEVLADELLTVYHFTSTEIAELIGENGLLRAGSYVTTEDLSGMTAAEVEQYLEITAGKGATSTTFQTPASNLGPAVDGPVTSGGAVQYQLVNPTRVTTFVPTPK